MGKPESEANELNYFRQMEEDLASFAQVGYWIYHVQSRTFSWSKGVLLSLGLAVGNMEPTLDNYLEHLHEDDKPLLLKAFQQTLSSRTHYTIQLRHLQPGGGYRHIKSTVQPVIESGEVVRLKGIMLDITESYENDKRVVQLTKMHQDIRSALEHSAIVFVLGKLGELIYM